MSLAYYFDQHVPAAIRDGLRRKGIAVLTAAEGGRADFPDDELLARSAALGTVIFTQDADFLALARSWAESDRPHAGIVYGHQLQITVGQAIRDLELIAQIMDAREMANRVEFFATTVSGRCRSLRSFAHGIPA